MFKPNKGKDLGKILLNIFQEMIITEFTGLKV